MRSARLAVAAAVFSAVCGCSSAYESGNEDSPSEAAPDAGDVGTSAAPGTPLALLTHGDEYTFERLDDAAYEVSVNTTSAGCISVTLTDGREMLLYAPFGSHVSKDSPRVRLAGEYGYPAFDVGSYVELRGWVKEIWKAAGASAPRDWRQCVGGRRDHQPMLVIATNDA